MEPVLTPIHTSGQLFASRLDLEGSSCWLCHQSKSLAFEYHWISRLPQTSRAPSNSGSRTYLRFRGKKYGGNHTRDLGQMTRFKRVHTDMITRSGRKSEWEVNVSLF